MGISWDKEALICSSNDILLVFLVTRVYFWEYISLNLYLYMKCTRHFCPITTWELLQGGINYTQQVFWTPTTNELYHQANMFSQIHHHLFWCQVGHALNNSLRFLKFMGNLTGDFSLRLLNSKWCRHENILICFFSQNLYLFMLIRFVSFHFGHRLY